VVEIKSYWDRLEWKRIPTYRHLPLEHSGAAAAVNECVITRAHDRSLPLRLRMFLKDNSNKKNFQTTGGNENKEPASSWECAKGIVDVVSALNNFADVYACLWPQDPTPRVLLRVLTHYQFGGAVAGNERERCKLMEEFCDTVMRENARRAIVQEMPLSFQQAKERWRDLAEQRRAVPHFQGAAGEPAKAAGQQGRKGPAVSGSASGPASGGSGNGGGGRRTAVQYSQPPSGKSGFIARNAVVKFNGELICFHFNNAGRGCGRAPRGAGCDDGHGGTYAHVCNFETSPGVYCFQKHPRHANH
jgi:hypothetical protein